MKVTILEKPEGKTWAEEEVSSLVRAGTEVERLKAKPNRIIACNKPLTGDAFEDIIGHSNFTVKMVDYSDRWE